MVPLGPSDKIEGLTHEFRRAIASRRPGAEAASGRALRALIWEPVEKLLGDGSPLLIAPDGPLCLVPLAALPGKALENYLIEERPVALVVAPQRLVDRPELPKADPSLLVVGNVDYDHTPYELSMEFANPEITPRNVALPQWSRLPGTRDEMYAIRDLCEEYWANQPCKLLPGRLASKGVVRQAYGGPRWFHLATHGFYADDLRPSYISTLPTAAAEAPLSLATTWNLASIHPNLLSGLVLAGANRPTASPNDDGLWTARDVEQLDLRNTELVVLSACETGLGELRRGEGLLGLRRAFHSAGARNVMASLWKVDDAATRRLMEAFYEHLWKNGLPKPEALRQAQIAMLRGQVPLPPGVLRGATPMEEDADEAIASQAGRLAPFYWAAFALSGDGR